MPRDYMTKLRARYEATLPAKTAEAASLVERLDRGDESAPEELRRFAHDIFGSGASYGWPALSEAARVVQDAAEHEQAGAARALLATLKNATASTRKDEA